ncbi:MAG: nucleoside diphosphate kinase regulator [Mesorhizobium sp.]
MQHATKPHPRNRLRISDIDHDRLTVLARASLDRTPATAEELLGEVDRATIMTAAAMPANVVRMGSTVITQGGSGNLQRVTLVYPGYADIAEGRISVLTPMGTALIGAAVGQTVSWKSRDGRKLSATIGGVESPSPDPRP